jgi:GNAT superfamily N-acetyltransferase
MDASAARPTASCDTVYAVLIRPLESTDSLDALTDLLHRSYAPLLAMGLRFVATHQDVEVTRSRVSGGQCFVAVEDGELIGTLTVYLPEGDESGYYARPGVAHFGQFAVDPGRQGAGVGRRLLDAAESYARSNGCRELALDTSDQATHLIELYKRWGYEIVDNVRWSEVNYASVVMAKPLIGIE